MHTYHAYEDIITTLFSLCFYININTLLYFPFNTQKCILKQSTLVFIVHTSSSSFNTTVQQAFVLLYNNLFNYPSRSYFYYKKLFLKNVFIEIYTAQWIFKHRTHKSNLYQVKKQIIVSTPKAPGASFLRLSISPLSLW